MTIENQMELLGFSTQNLMLLADHRYSTKKAGAGRSLAWTQILPLPSHDQSEIKLIAPFH